MAPCNSREIEGVGRVAKRRTHSIFPKVRISILRPHPFAGPRRQPFLRFVRTGEQEFVCTGVFFPIWALSYVSVQWGLTAPTSLRRLSTRGRTRLFSSSMRIDRNHLPVGDLGHYLPRPPIGRLVLYGQPSSEESPPHRGGHKAL